MLSGPLWLLLEVHGPPPIDPGALASGNITVAVDNSSSFSTGNTVKAKGTIASIFVADSFCETFWTNVTLQAHAGGGDTLLTLSLTQAVFIAV